MDVEIKILTRSVSSLPLSNRQTALLFRHLEVPFKYQRDESLFNRFLTIERPINGIVRRYSS